MWQSKLIPKIIGFKPLNEFLQSLGWKWFGHVKRFNQEKAPARAIMLKSKGEDLKNDGWKLLKKI